MHNWAYYINLYIFFIPSFPFIPLPAQLRELYIMTLRKGSNLKIKYLMFLFVFGDFAFYYYYCSVRWALSFASILPLRHVHLKILPFLFLGENLMMLVSIIKLSPRKRSKWSGGGGGGGCWIVRKCRPCTRGYGWYTDTSCFITSPQVVAVFFLRHNGNLLRNTTW